MEPKIVTLESFTVMGPQRRINPVAADYRDLWENQFMPHHGVIAARADRPGYYGVYFAADEPGMAEFIAGMAVTAGGEPPAPLAVREVPGGLFAAFECSMAEIAGVWGFIYQTWLPQSEEFVEDPARPCFEQYPPEQDTGAMRVTIHIPLREKR